MYIYKTNIAVIVKIEKKWKGDGQSWSFLQMKFVKKRQKMLFSLP